ncbi:SBBP repeat-containing protein, partial [Kaarinaea lacus]
MKTYISFSNILIILLTLSSCSGGGDGSPDGGSDLDPVDSTWIQQLGSVADDNATAVAVDKWGNVYIAGETNEAIDEQSYIGNTDVFVTKFNAAGVKQWTRQIGTASYEYPSDITIDSQGNAYVVGSINASLDGQDYAGSGDLFLIKFNSDGDKIWTHLSGTASNDSATGVATDGSNVYVSGYTRGALDDQTSAFLGNPDLVVMKFNTAGEKQWT